MLSTLSRQVQLRVGFRSLHMWIITCSSYKEADTTSESSESDHGNADTTSISSTTSESSTFPEEPTTCCMSGCANCVWLDYVEKVTAYYRDGGELARKEIEERVQDPSMKAFLMSELRIKEKMKGDE